MNKITRHSARDLTYRFYGPDFLPADEDEGALRDVQWARPTRWRNLKSAETEQLVANGNSHPDWSIVRVTDRFNPKLVRGCRFGGFVRIGDLENFVLEFEGMKMPVGLYNSTILACDIGNNAVVNRVGHLANTLVGDGAVLHNVGTILARPGAKFGNGFVWEGEDEARRAWMELWNETGRRGVAPWEGMLPADAWLWAKYRGDGALMERLRRMTDEQWNRLGVQYGTIGNRTVIRNVNTMIDVKVGSDALIDGAGRLENVTVRSDEREGTTVLGGADLADGIVGFGCVVGVGAKARRFVMGTRSRLLCGAWLLNSFLGDNSTVACCEVLNCLIFPGHEQHHNNSFLIAAAVQGQSNVAAGATIGSNNNTRGPEGELLAERGFWPGLCSSFKHPSHFAAFTLVAKGDYAYELNVPYPFSLVSNDEQAGCLQVAPAWWFMYNMYAVTRNAWKYRARDARVHAEQHIEQDVLAPDTLEAMLAAAGRLEELAGRAALAKEGNAAVADAARTLGRRLLGGEPGEAEALEILDPEVEHSRRKVRVLKAAAAWAMYRAMAHYYAVRTVLEFMEARGVEELGALDGLLGGGERERHWVNMGGQLVAGRDLDRLKARIAAGELDSWDAIHKEYDLLWEQYPEARARHAWGVLRELHGAEPDAAAWAGLFAQAEATQAMIAEQTRASRAKDFEGAARRMTCDTPEELAAVAGTLEDDANVKRVNEAAAAFGERLARVRERNGIAARAD